MRPEWMAVTQQLSECKLEVLVARHKGITEGRTGVKMSDSDEGVCLSPSSLMHCL